MRGLTNRFVLAVAVVGSLVGVGERAQAGLIIFTNESAFEAAAPGLTNQDFSAANVANGSLANMGNPLNSSTNNGIFSTGYIKAALTITATGNDPGNDLTIAGVNALGNTQKTVFANVFTESLNLSFAPTSTAIGAKLLSEFGTSNFLVSVFGPSNTLLGQFTDSSVPNNGPGSFFGVIGTAGDTISRINYDSTTNQAEGVSFVEFGNPVLATPEPSTIVSAGIGGVLMLAGYTWRRARSQRHRRT